jgi:hypothetical protein
VVSEVLLKDSPTNVLLEPSWIFPPWAPEWLRDLVENPDCSSGTHPRLRQLAKWLCVYFPPDELPGAALHWLREAANRCDRVPDDAELKRLIAWARAITGQDQRGTQGTYQSQSSIKPDLERIYELIIAGLTLEEYRETSPLRLWDAPERQSAAVLDLWQVYSDISDPWVCYGSRDRFWARPLSFFRERAQVFEQIVPSPMRAQKGITVDGHESEHSKDGTGPRLCLVTEFDFSPVTPRRKPSIWASLIKRCAERDRSVLDMNAALAAHLSSRGPHWLSVYSGGKSIQNWFACKGVDEHKLHDWFRREALSLGACSSTWTPSQFVRMPDGTRDDGRRQTIEYCAPQILTATTKKEFQFQ